MVRDRQRLVDDHTPFVRAQAAKLKEALPREVEFEDLVAFGMQGLLEASERYDPRHGVAFTTYAYYRVRGAMFDGLRGMGWLHRAELERQRLLEAADGYLQNAVERDLGAAQLRSPGAPPPEGPDGIDGEVRHISELLGGLAAILVASFDADEERAAHPDRHLERRERSRAILGALGRLPERERRLLHLYYYEERSLEEAGQALGLSKSWASRLHARAIALLQRALERTAAAPDTPRPKPRPRARR